MGFTETWMQEHMLNITIHRFQTIRADRAASAEQASQCLLTTDGVLLDISNCWVEVSVHVVYWESSPVSPADAASDACWGFNITFYYTYLCIVLIQSWYTPFWREQAFYPQCEGLKQERHWVECWEKLLHAYKGSQNRWDEAYSGKVPDTGR